MYVPKALFLRQMASAAPLLQIATSASEWVGLARDVLSSDSTGTTVESYAQLLRDCGSGNELSKGKQIHAQIAASKLGQNVFLANLLVEMYGKCGSLEEARKVFNRIQQPNLFSWNIMVAAYAQNGYMDEAKAMFDRMPQRDPVSWTAMIATYAHDGQLQEAQNLFDEMPQRDVVSWNAMIIAYAQNGQVKEARRMFDEMPQRNVVSWNTMITIYADSQCLEEAEAIFARMPDRNVVSWNAMVTAYAQNGQLKQARSIFDKMPDRNVVSWTTMLQGYLQNSELREARDFFDRMPERGVVSWTSLIAAYAQNGNLHEANSLFDQMPERNVVTWNALMAAYAQNGHLETARNMFEKMPQRDKISWITMIAASAQNGHLLEARILFDEMPQKDTVAWSVIIAANSQNGQSKLAMLLFRMMDLEGMRPDASTFTGVLHACANLAALSDGKLIHADIVDAGTGIMESDVTTGCALVNMYGKCGQLDEAMSVFKQMPQHNAVSWSALIAVYAQNGHGKDALELFYAMHVEGVKPDEVTFITVLSVCSHSGLCKQGWSYFVSMITDHGLEPSGEHYNCMIDLLGRAGWLNEAEDLINHMPYSPTASAWTALVGSCKVHGDVERGGRCANHVIDLEPANSAPYVLVSNVTSIST